MVKENKKSMLLKAGAIGVAGLLVGGLGAGIYYNANPVVDVQVNPINEELKEDKEDLKLDLEELEEYIAELEAQEPEVINKTVEVDNGNLDLVLDYMLDGNVSLVTDDLEDDELDLIVDRITFLNDAEELIKQFLTKNIAEELEETKGFVDDADKVDLIAIDSLELSDANFTKYEEFGYMSVKGTAKVWFTYDDSDLKKQTVDVEIWNDKIRFIYD